MNEDVKICVHPRLSAANKIPVNTSNLLKPAADKHKLPLIHIIFSIFKMRNPFILTNIVQPVTYQFI